MIDLDWPMLRDSLLTMAGLIAALVALGWGIVRIAELRHRNRRNGGDA